MAFPGWHSTIREDWIIIRCLMVSIGETLTEVVMERIADLSLVWLHKFIDAPACLTLILEQRRSVRDDPQMGAVLLIERVFVALLSVPRQGGQRSDECCVEQAKNLFLCCCLAYPG